MNCEEFGARLTAYSLGELPDDDAAAARAHLARCDRCATLVLRDRELAGRLRTSAVPAPAAVHRAVLLALRQERLLRRRRLMRRVAGAAAAAAFIGVVSYAPSAERTTAQPAPAPVTAAASTQQRGPLAAAWSAYQAPILPLDRVGAGDPLLLGFIPATPELEQAGLRLVAAGTLRLAGRPAFATEYESESGERLTVFRWKGTLPETGGDYPSGSRPELRIYRTGLTSSAWWDDGELVWCAVGDLDQPTFEQALTRIRRSA